MISNRPMQMGILGCGDFLRWMAPGIKASQNVTVKWLYDPANERAAQLCRRIGRPGGRIAGAIFADPEVDIVCLFVPPWLRTDLWVQAAQAGKHILATKPLAASAADCERIAALGGGTRAGVLYGRWATAGRWRSNACSTAARSAAWRFTARIGCITTRSGTPGRLIRPKTAGLSWTR